MIDLEECIKRVVERGYFWSRYDYGRSIICSKDMKANVIISPDTDQEDFDKWLNEA